jgi:hypothetical protein
MGLSPEHEREQGGTPQCPLRGRSERENDLATFLSYLKFCRRHCAYNACVANQIRIFDWVDERRIEMLAEGRPHWVPSTRDFEMAERDCWDDLVKL